MFTTPLPLQLMVLLPSLLSCYNIFSLSAGFEIYHVPQGDYELDEDEVMQFYSSQVDSLGGPSSDGNVDYSNYKAHAKGNDGGGGTEEGGGGGGGSDGPSNGGRAKKGMIQMGSVHSISSSHASKFATSFSSSSAAVAAGESDNSSSNNSSASTNGCPTTSCEGVSTYALLPVLPNCREYVLCQNRELTLTFSCPEGTIFDAGRRRCDAPEADGGEAVCSCVDENEKGAEGGGGGAGGSAVVELDPIEDGGGYATVDDPMMGVEEELDRTESAAGSLVDVGSFDFGGAAQITEDDRDNISFKQDVSGGGVDIVSLATEESILICQGQYSALLPLETTGCKYYVSCVDSKPSFINQCSDNLLFDISIMGCNWNHLVDCPTMSPTARPTDWPTREPTRRPQVTDEPTKSAPSFLNPPPPPPPTPPRPTPPRPTPPPTTRRPTPNPTPRMREESPDIFQWLQDHRRALNQDVFRSYTQQGVEYRSYWFQYQDFYGALRLMAGMPDADNADGGSGVSAGAGATFVTGQGLGGSGGSVTGLDKHVFYVGQDDPQNHWEYGLVNVAAFLAHAMTESITNDACDEFHWEKNTDADVSDENRNHMHYAVSNSCGQDDGQNYQEFRCDADEAHMQCDVDRNMVLQATTSLVYPNAPPPLSCKPRSAGESYTGYWDIQQGQEVTAFPYENSYGRTDTEGCCFWGRGAIHSRGVCNIGKINYYMGKRAADDGRPSRYPTTDFCAFPEAICAAPESREMRWTTSMFEWAERVQTYDDMEGWDYMRKLKEFVDGGLTDFDFLEATSGILAKGCHDPPCFGSGTKKNGGWGTGDVHLAEERVTNFQTILIALEAGGEDALIRALIKYFTDREDIMNSEILRSQTPQGQLYPSYRYQLPDYLAALTYMSETGVGGRKFYTGEARVPNGVRYGIVNAIMYLSQAYKEAIQYDACDENNWEMVNDRFPLSNSCGQLGMSYQDMHCREDEAFMECPVKADMEQVALTNALWFQAPGPLKCGPRSKFPTTGFWDYDLGREDNGDAYANGRGRVDVEGCCWWGRGVIQTKGTCNYGKLNYFLGKRAADEGRPSLYPEIDFCEFPQGVCSSDDTYGNELQWMVGFFEWTDRVQTYDVDGWNYIDELKKFCDGAYKDFSFVDAVSGVLNLGCHDPPCMGFANKVVDPHNKRERNDTFQRFLNQLQVARNFRPPPMPTPMPSPVPTDAPIVLEPTTNTPTFIVPPTESPTSTSRPTAVQGRPPEAAVRALEDELKRHEERFSDLVLRSEHPSGEMWPSYLYTFQGLLDALIKMTTGTGPGEKNFFYVGDGYSSNSVEYGLVNLAAFVAQSVTQSIHYDACDENNWEMVQFRYPISNSCGQGGQSYQDDVCEDGDAGMECDVDPDMEIYGVTMAGWVGAPPPMYCADRSVGYWDHVTGLEENDPPFKNKRGRSDIKGCCWWGRGALQVKGVCSYGRLNHWLGAKAKADGRPAIYPDIDFCKNPDAICSDKLSHELRWVTGMFQWVLDAQRNREYDYFQTLKRFADGGDYKNDKSFIGMLNNMLGGSPDDIEKRTNAFNNALRAFDLISVETKGLGAPFLTFCGENHDDAGSKCEPCRSNADCTGMELCYSEVMLCDTSAEDLDISDPEESEDTEDTNAMATDDKESSPEIIPMSGVISINRNYCGESWTDAATNCASACPSGANVECAPGHFCFGDITTCSNDNIENSDVAGTNYCGTDWTDAFTRCSATCPGGSDAECPLGLSCFADISC